MIFQRKYGVALSGDTLITVPMIKAGSTLYAGTGDWTPGAGDVRVKVGTAAFANIASLPTAVAIGGNGTGAFWQFTLGTAELQAKRVMVAITKGGTSIEDNGFVIETFGHASAMYPADYTADTSDVEARLTASAKAIVYGTCGTGGTHTTTDVFVGSSDPAIATTDQFKGRVVLFAKDTTTTNLRGQGAPIEGNTTGTAAKLTIGTANALSNAPTNGDTFVIV